MTETIISTARELCNYLPYLYVFMFLLCIGVQKQLSSLSITIILVASAEFIMDNVASPFLSFLNNNTFGYDVKMSMWSLFWCYMYAGIVLFLNKSHQWLNITKETKVKVVQYLFTVLALIQVIDYLNIFLLKSEHLSFVYEFGTPATGLAIATFLLYQLLISIKDHYVNRGRSASTAI